MELSLLMMDKLILWELIFGNWSRERKPCGNNVILPPPGREVVQFKESINVYVVARYGWQFNHVIHAVQGSPPAACQQPSKYLHVNIWTWLCQTFPEILVVLGAYSWILVYYVCSHLLRNYPIANSLIYPVCHGMPCFSSEEFTLFIKSPLNLSPYHDPFTNGVHELAVQTFKNEWKGSLMEIWLITTLQCLPTITPSWSI